MNIGMLLLVIIGGFAGLFSTLYICISLPFTIIWKIYRRVAFNILIPNKNTGVMLRHSSSLFYYFLSLFVRLHITIATITRITPNISPADKVSLYSITPIKVAATGSTDAKIEAFPLSKFLRPAVYRQNASTVLKKTNFKLADKNSHASPKYPCQNYHS